MPDLRRQAAARRLMEMHAMWSGVRYISVRSCLPELRDKVSGNPVLQLWRHAADIRLGDGRSRAGGTVKQPIQFARVGDQEVGKTARRLTINYRSGRGFVNKRNSDAQPRISNRFEGDVPVNWMLSRIFELETRKL